MVFYRKYRPQTIEELDSSKLRESLYAVLSRQDIPHAFLLTGPKGLGKTSTARIIAKVVNCLHSKQSHVASRTSQVKKEKVSDPRPTTYDQLEPDNTCEQCVSITNGSNIDVLEIDGASNRGIDEIRDLRDKVKLAPSRAKKKVYIIDEVHMLTTEAFNALLKTIEEPPAHVMFVFCTTEPQKVPQTIISRCFHVAYPKATQEDLVRSFGRIIAGEKIAIDDKALRMIASLSDGGFRDGAKILEELVTLSQGKKITPELIEEKYQIASISYFVSSTLEALDKKDTIESIAIVKKIVEQGIDLKYFIVQLLESLHAQLLEMVGIEKNTKYQISNTSYALEDIEILTRLFSEAYQETKYAAIPSLPLEMAVISWCTKDNGEESSKVSMGSDRTKQSNSTQDSEAAFHSSKEVLRDTKHSMDTLLRKEKNLKVQEILKGPQSKTDEAPAQKGKINSQEELTDKTVTEQLMENLIYKVKALNFSVAGVLRGCVVKKFESGEVILQTSYKFHKEKLDEAKTRDILEKAIKEITGRDMQVVVELKN